MVLKMIQKRQHPSFPHLFHYSNSYWYTFKHCSIIYCIWLISKYRATMGLSAGGPWWSEPPPHHLTPLACFIIYPLLKMVTQSIAGKAIPHPTPLQLNLKNGRACPLSVIHLRFLKIQLFCINTFCLRAGHNQLPRIVYCSFFKLNRLKTNNAT